MDIFEIAGIGGFFCYMGSYSLLQLGKISGNGISYSVLNMLAALFILVSLSDSFNFGSALVQTAWITLSVLGICRALNNQLKEEASQRQTAQKRQKAKQRQQRASHQASHRVSDRANNSDINARADNSRPVSRQTRPSTDSSLDITSTPTPAYRQLDMAS